MYEFFEHTADVGLRVQTTTLDQLFADAARGLFSMVAPNLDAVQGVLERRYELTGEDAPYAMKALDDLERQQHFAPPK